MKKIILLLTICLFSVQVFASPFNGEIMQFKQPDGSTVDVKLYGTELFMRAEGLDGYTLVRDPQTNYICYARLSADARQFVSTGIVYKGISGDVSTLRNDLPMAKHVTLSAQGQTEVIKKNKIATEGTAKGQTHPTNSVNHKIATTPSGLISGTITGLCIVVDFSDEPGTLPMSEFDAFCNSLTYNNFGNNGSLRKYYKDVSGGLLDYQNVVYGYFRAPQTFAYYDALPYAQGAQDILGLALNWLDAQGFDFSTLTTNPDGSIQAINLMYTGTPPNWAQGMWHHKGNYTGFSADGVYSNDYNCSPAGSPLRLAVVAHENGHMIGKWPDTYKYTSTNGPDGIGSFDLMCSYGSSYNPTPPNPLFRSNAGWGRVVDLTNYNGINIDTANSTTCFKYRNINDTNEFFLFENRRKTGRSQYVPDQGLTIWHIDKLGDNQTTHHEVWLEHADNDYSNENNACFHSNFNDEYGPTTMPGSNFYNGDPSGLRIWDISAAINIMNYKLGEGQAGPALNLMFNSVTNDGNANGFIEPAETADLNVNALNFGQLSSSTASVTCQAIGANTSYVTVNNSMVNVGVINVSQNVPAAFNISVAANTPLGTELQFKFSISDGTDSIYITKKFIVGVVVKMDNQNFTTCSALFYDENLESNYNDNTHYTKTFFPLSAGQAIIADFLEFDVENAPNCMYDYLNIYDGPSVSSPLIGMYCAGSPGIITSTHPGGALTFEFHSDEGFTGTGWKAIISCNGVSGIKTHNNAVVFDVNPNPSSGTVVIKTNYSDYDVTVTDLIGREVTTVAVKNSTSYTLNITDIPDGVYFVKLKSGDQSAVKKIVISK